MKRAFLILATIAVGGILVFSGYKIFGDNKTKTTQKNSAQQATSGQSSSQKPASDPSEGGKYLVIKEWGVRFLYPSKVATNSLRYDYNTENQGEGLTSVGFDSVQDNLAGCIPFRIWRQKGSQTSNAASEKIEIKGPVTINGFSYTWAIGASACDTQNAQRTKDAQEIQAELSDNLNKLEAVPN